MEDFMSTMLRVASELSDPVARSVFSGTRLRTSMDFINRIYEATGKTDKKVKLYYYFSQLASINTMRDDIVHYGVSFTGEEGKLRFTNWRSAHIQSKFKNFSINAQLVDRMHDDLQTIILGVIIIIQGDVMATEDRERLQNLLPSTWQYKPPQQEPLPEGTPLYSE